MPDTRPTIENAPNYSPQKDKWTLMFLIAGDAALSASMISQLKELTDAGFQKDTNVLLYFDPNCNGKGARVYDVNQKRKKKSKTGTDIGDGTNPFVRNIDDDCSIQSLQQIPAARSLRYFLTYSRSYYPAENYMLFLMGHGVIVGNDQFLPDTDDGSSITLEDLGKILKNFGVEVRKTGDEFHLVGFHSCGMSSVELAFELQDSARYMLGTQGSAFPGSWPYRQLLKKIFNEIDRSCDDQKLKTGPYPNELVQKILKGLQNLSFYNARDFSDAGFSADLTMCSLDKEKLDGLKKALQILVGELKKGLTNSAKASILLAHWESQSYFGESYTDLYDFCERLQRHCVKNGSHDAIVKACKKVRRVLESERCDNPKDKGKTDPDGLFQKVVVFSDYYGPAFQHSNGLSIFFPWKVPTAQVTTNYASYKFTDELGPNSWMSFLNEYFFETKRPMNGKKKVTRDFFEKSATESSLQGPQEELSDEQLLRLGPPPRQKEFAVAQRIATIQEDIRKLAEKMANLEKETGTPAKRGTGTLAKETATLAKDIGSLAKEMGTLAASKETATLAAGMVTLAVKMANLEKAGTLSNKETGTLAKETATLAKETATLAKETATLAKETGTLSKETATLAKETGTLSKETATLAKETATLAKETATLGLFGNTTIKNFDTPEGKTISSRPWGEPNPGRDQSDDARVPLAATAGR